MLHLLPFIGGVRKMNEEIISKRKARKVLKASNPDREISKSGVDTMREFSDMWVIRFAEFIQKEMPKHDIREGSQVRITASHIKEAFADFTKFYGGNNYES
jgi:hypothetical protein